MASKATHSTISYSRTNFFFRLLHDSQYSSSSDLNKKFMMEKEPKAELPSDVEASIAGKSVEEAPKSQGERSTFPEGGLRAWSVAVGCAGVLFSTFGYVNTFGCVPYFGIFPLLD